MIDPNLIAACEDARTVAQVLEEKATVAAVLGCETVVDTALLKQIAKAMRSLSTAAQMSETVREEYAITTAKLAIAQTLDVPLGELVGLWSRFQLARVKKPAK